MRGLQLEMDPAPSREDLAVLQRGLQAFNREQGLELQAEELSLLVRDPRQRVQAGLFGRSYWGWTYVKWLWVAPRLRAQGWGRRLMERAEQEARRRGCRGMFLDSFSFQAPGFYQKLGYEEFGRLEGLPPGGARVYLRKLLVGP